MSLKEYARKRDFEKTAEPEAKLSRDGAGRRFVIQKHAASRLHYDFRLELGRTLKSWAVPKGIPFGKGEKHLAVEVEDHPVSYIDFEGTIPEGQYGGGKWLQT
jgi:bifunctional non-homologous end joining protein LigD